MRKKLGLVFNSFSVSSSLLFQSIPTQTRHNSTIKFQKIKTNNFSKIGWAILSTFSHNYNRTIEGSWRKFGYLVTIKDNPSTTMLLKILEPLTYTFLLLLHSMGLLQPSLISKYSSTFFSAAALASMIQLLYIGNLMAGQAAVWYHS